MARKAETTKKAASTKKAAAKSRKKTSSEPVRLECDHAEAAYYKWLQRGAPLWDDQQDWFDVTRK